MTTPSFKSLSDWYHPDAEKIDLTKVQLKDFFTDEEWTIKCTRDAATQQADWAYQTAFYDQLREWDVVQLLNNETGIHPLLAHQLLVYHQWNYGSARNEVIVQKSILTAQFSNKTGIDESLAFQLLEHNQWDFESSEHHLVSILTQQLVSETGIDEPSASQLIFLHQLNFERARQEAAFIVSSRNALYRSIQGNKTTSCCDGPSNTSNGLFGILTIVGEIGYVSLSLHPIR